MRCSSCEILLDRYVEATLSAKQMLAVSKHVQSCTSCASLVTELRVVDALLSTTKTVELAPNFTFALMAEVRTMPAPSMRKLSMWAVLSFYTVGAWIAVITAMLTFAPHLGVLSSFALRARSSIGEAIDAIGGTAHAFGPSAPFVAAFVVTVLAVDVALAAALILFYRNVRPRLAAQLATSEAP